MQAEAPDVDAARTRARRRLIGAAVLVLVAVIGFPLVFETQPRPTATGTSIEVARNDASTAAKALPSRAVTGVVTSASRGNEVITETAGEGGREVPPPASAAPAPARAAAKEPAAARQVAPTSASAAPRPSPVATVKTPVVEADAGRAQALLEGKTDVANAESAKPDAAKPDSHKADKPRPEGAKAGAVADESADKSGRFVVQVGAFADVNAARDVRQRVEKLGLKTYTQVIDTPGGKRIRVRVGPFGAKDEADRVVARIKSAGLSPAVLTL